MLAEASFVEHFAPVAEVLAWMDDAPYTPTAITYVVRPRVPPAVTSRPRRERVALGAPLAVTADASDNVRVNRVEFRLGGQAPVVDTSAPYAAEVPTAGLAPGDPTLTVTAVDGAGQATAAARTVALDPVANGAGAGARREAHRGVGRRLTRGTPSPTRVRTACAAALRPRRAPR